MKTYQFLFKMTLLFTMVFGNVIVTNAQIKKEQLIGCWQLSHFTNKKISESEQKKNYVFSTDSLWYNSPQRKVNGMYKLDEKNGELAWYPNNVLSPVLFFLKHINKDTLHLSQPNMNATIGVLVRKK